MVPILQALSKKGIYMFNITRNGLDAISKDLERYF